MDELLEGGVALGPASFDVVLGDDEGAAASAESHLLAAVMSTDRLRLPNVSSSLVDSSA